MPSGRMTEVVNLARNGTEFEFFGLNVTVEDNLGITNVLVSSAIIFFWEGNALPLGQGVLLKLQSLNGQFNQGVKIHYMYQSLDSGDAYPVEADQVKSREIYLAPSKVSVKLSYDPYGILIVRLFHHNEVPPTPVYLLPQHQRRV